MARTSTLLRSKPVRHQLNREAPPISKEEQQLIKDEIAGNLSLDNGFTDNDDVDWLTLEDEISHFLQDKQ